MLRYGGVKGRMTKWNIELYTLHELVISGGAVGGGSGGSIVARSGLKTDIGRELFVQSKEK